MIFDWILQSRKHRTNAELIVVIRPKKPFSSVMRLIALWRNLWRYCINANIKTWYPEKPHILKFTLIPSSFFSDHSAKLYGWMRITFKLPSYFVKQQQFLCCYNVNDFPTLKTSMLLRIQTVRNLVKSISIPDEE